MCTLCAFSPMLLTRDAEMETLYATAPFPPAVPKGMSATRMARTGTTGELRVRSILSLDSSVHISSNDFFELFHKRRVASILSAVLAARCFSIISEAVARIVYICGIDGRHCIAILTVQRPWLSTAATTAAIVVAIVYVFDFLRNSPTQPQRRIVENLFVRLPFPRALLNAIYVPVIDIGPLSDQRKK